MALRPIPYERLGPLIRDHLSTEEDAKTLGVIRQLRPARERRYLTPAELEAICYWKSPRAIRLIRRNSPEQVRRATRTALRTRSENELRHEFCQMEPHRTVFFETYLVTQHRSHLPANENGMVNVA